MDEEANGMLIDKEGLLSKPQSHLQAWVIPTDEGLEIAHECFLALNASIASERR
jgi:acetate kinase